MICIGIDVGSITTKAAALVDGRLVASRVIFSGYRAEKAGREALDGVLADLGIDRGGVAALVATGYGRRSLGFADRVVTEISCHAAGAHFLDGQVRSVIDIGGQDSKVIRLDDRGRVADFAMNDKCAAGTGRFLEVMARALELDLDAFGALSLEADRPAPISSLCTVFAESEVISLIAKGESRKNIIAGIHQSIGARIVAMAGRTGLCPPIMMTGGVARNVGVRRVLEQMLGTEIRVAEQAQIAGAIGAALAGAA